MRKLTIHFTYIDDIMRSFQEFIRRGQVRDSSLKRLFPDVADQVYRMAEEEAKERFEGYRRLASL